MFLGVSQNTYIFQAFDNHQEKCSFPGMTVSNVSSKIVRWMTSFASKEIGGHQEKSHPAMTPQHSFFSITWLQNTTSPSCMDSA